MLADHAHHRSGEYRVWSAAASTGEEPYGVAMTLADTWAPRRTLESVASDIDAEVLEKPEAVVYRHEETEEPDAAATATVFHARDGAA
ncbi:CheR family methyltransferase [Shigella flexneri]